ncbi:MAG: DMT family transporter [Beijerinckiaceae bacterium]|nr:DMT family transporter [Beijerinckiaceae bacterium]
MTSHHSSASATARGIFCLIASVGLFGIVDGLSKMIIEYESFGQIMLSRYLLPLILTIVLTKPKKRAALFSTENLFLQLSRGIMPVMVGSLMVLAVTYLPLAEATVILFAGPFFVVSLSGWFLGERVSLDSWVGVAIGFVAVLLVARPGFTDVSLYTVLPAIAALFYAGLQLMSRRLGALGIDPNSTLAWTLLIGTTLSLPLAIYDWRPLDWGMGLISLGLAGAFGFGQYFLAKAYALAPANSLAPFTYFQILSAVIFGIVVFGDIPNILTGIGILMIISAGIYVFGKSLKT